MLNKTDKIFIITATGILLLCVLPMLVSLFEMTILFPLSLLLSLFFVPIAYLVLLGTLLKKILTPQKVKKDYIIIIINIAAISITMVLYCIAYFLGN
ncbi:MAG: hypothetical protein LBK53_02505 [Heliobacteriaceae bacterium]|jgi:hypothetical protein|nr:hypothetical protein [Heliobacteriaceae bacterium]